MGNGIFLRIKTEIIDANNVDALDSLSEMTMARAKTWEQAGKQVSRQAGKQATLFQLGLMLRPLAIQSCYYAEKNMQDQLLTNF